VQGTNAVDSGGTDTQVEGRTRRRCSPFFYIRQAGPCGPGFCVQTPTVRAGVPTQRAPWRSHRVACEHIKCENHVSVRRAVWTWNLGSFYSKNKKRELGISLISSSPIEHLGSWDGVSHHGMAPACAVRVTEQPRSKPAVPRGNPEGKNTTKQAYTLSCSMCNGSRSGGWLRAHTAL